MESDIEEKALFLPLFEYFIVVDGALGYGEVIAFSSSPLKLSAGVVYDTREKLIRAQKTICSTLSEACHASSNFGHSNIDVLHAFHLVLYGCASTSNNEDKRGLKNFPVHFSVLAQTNDVKRGSIREQIDFMVAGADPEHYLRRRNFKELRIFLSFELRRPDRAKFNASRCQLGGLKNERRRPDKWRWHFEKKVEQFLADQKD
ncbi:hypothetical protein ACFE04_021562 [Oxalis oulophora]